MRSLFTAAVLAASGCACSSCGNGSRGASADADAAIDADDASGLDATTSVDAPDSGMDGGVDADTGPDISPDGLWRKIPAALYTLCPWWEGDVSKITPPSRMWTSCGDGCREAQAIHSGYAGAYDYSLAAAARGGDFLVRLQLGKKTSTGAEIFTEYSQIGTGKLVAALRQTEKVTTCTVGGESPLLAAGGGKGQLVHGRLDEPSGKIAWQEKLVPYSSPVRATATWSGGTAVFLDDGSIATITSRSQDSLNVIAVELPTVYRVASGDSQVLWATGNGRIRRLGSDGVRTLFTDDYLTPGAGQSSKWIVWTAAERDDAGSGYAWSEFRWSPWTDVASGFAKTIGPTIPQQNYVAPVLVSDDHAATLGCDKTACSVFVVRLSTRKLWRIPYRSSDRLWTNIYAISDTSLLLGERDVATDPSLLDRFVLLELDRLDSYAK